MSAGLSWWLTYASCVLHPRSLRRVQQTFLPLWPFFPHVFPLGPAAPVGIVVFLGTGGAAGLTRDGYEAWQGVSGYSGCPVLVSSGNASARGREGGSRVQVWGPAQWFPSSTPCFHSLRAPRGEHRRALLCLWGLRGGATALFTGPPLLRMQPCGVTPPRRWTGSRPRGLPEGMLQVPGLARLDRRLRLVGIPVVCGQGPASSPGPPAPSFAACWAAPPCLSSASRSRDGCRDGGWAPPTATPTPPGSARGAQGSRRGRRRLFCYGECAVSASGRSFHKDSPGRSRRLSTPGVGRIRFPGRAAAPPGLPMYAALWCRPAS